VNGSGSIKVDAIELNFLCLGFVGVAHSWLKRLKLGRWSEAASTDAGARIFLLNATSETARLDGSRPVKAFAIVRVGERTLVVALSPQAADSLAGEPDREHERHDRKRSLLVARDPLADPL
jgi:hypothetical protein